MSTVIYARENSPASQSLKLKSGLNVGVSSIIITGMEGNTESFYFRKTDFGPLQHCFTASKDRRFSKLPRLSKLGHTVWILFVSWKTGHLLSAIGWSILTKVITQILWKNNIERMTSMWTLSTCIMLNSGFQSRDINLALQRSEQSKQHSLLTM